MGKNGRNRVWALAVFGDHRSVSRAPAFSGGTLVAVFGDVRLDLHDTQLAGDGATIWTIALFGDVEIVVPHGWIVIVSGLTLAGDAKDETASNESVKPITSTLTVRVFALAGDVRVYHRV